MGKRAFIIDHMAVLPYGHNLNSMRLFKRALDKSFDETTCLACSLISENAEASDMSRVLYYPYNGFIEALHSRKSQLPYAARIYSKIYGIAYKISSKALFRDIVMVKTRRNWLHVLKKHKISSDDLLFFPSADYYGTLALSKIIQKDNTYKDLRIHLRFIGVMENACYTSQTARAEVLQEVKKLVEKGYKITISAETPKYAAYLSRILQLGVDYLPYPLSGEQKKLKWSSTERHVASPGQGRMDKGYFRFAKIIEYAVLQNSSRKLHFILQSMGKYTIGYKDKYQRLLKQLPRLTLQPARLKQSEIDETYEKADILLLPYASDVYQYRGSAIYQEGVAIGRPFVATKGTGVADLIEKYQNGFLANHDDEIVKKLNDLSEMSKDEITQMTEKARKLYQRDFENSMDKIIAGLSDE